MLNLLKDILDYSKFKHKKIKINNLETDLRKELDLVFQIFKKKAKMRNIKLKKSIDE